MAYIGNLPATGQNNSFRLLDDITSYTLTFDGSSASVVNSSDKTIESANHRFVQGQRVVYAAGGGTPVANLTGGTAYFIIKQGGSHFQLAASDEDASNGVAISISAAGSATGHTLIASFDAVNTRFMASHSGGTKVNITRSAQLNISINGVIQEPQETASPTAGFGRDSGSVIVFSTAPNAGDEFWGSLVADNIPTFDISDNDVDNFTGDDSTTDFTLSKTPPDPRNILVTLDGVTQHPSDNTTTRAYTVTENILSFTSAPSTSVSIQVRHIGFAGATSGSAGVSAFYGRTGSVVLKNTDTINVANIVDEGYLAVGSTASFGGDVSIGGTLTYDDVTYVESVGIITANKGVEIPNDTFKYRAGTQLEMQVFHDGTDSLIKDTRDSGSVKIQADNFAVIDKDDSQTMLVAGVDGSVSLRHSGNEKFKTIGYGVTVVGAMQVSGMTTIFNQLTIQNANPILNFIDTNNDSDFRFQVEAGSFLIEDKSNNHADRFVLNSDGQVGIGTNPPQVKLHLHDTSNTRIQFTDASTGGASGDGVILGLNGEDDFFINNRESSKGIKFFTGSNTERMVIVSGGQVGFGITNPEDYFSSYNRVVMGRTNDTGGMTIVSSSTSGGYISFAKGTSGNQAYRGLIAYQHNGDYMTFNVDSTERLRITGAGITVTGEVAASQDYPNFRPTLDINFAAEKKLEPRITYSRTGPASFTNEFGKVVLVGGNAPRFDHDPATRECKGLLIEESRTNLLTYSHEFDQTHWSNVRTTDSKTVATNDPQGLQTAVKLVANTDNNTHRLDKTNLSMATSTAHTFSVWAKAAEYTGVSLTIADSSNNSHGVYFDLSAGTFTIGNNAHTGKMEAYPNGWYRCFATFTTPSSITFQQVLIGVLQNGTTHTYTGNGSSGIYIWGAQLEVGAFSTSYIPTDSTTATRGADIVEIEGEDFSDFYNQNEGTIMLSAIINSDNRTSASVTIDDTSNTSEYIEVGYRAGGGGSNKVGAFVRTDAGSDQYFKGFDNSATVGSEFKVAFGYKDNDYASSANGVGVHTDTSGTTSKVLDRLRLSAVDTVDAEGSGFYRRLVYYPKRLPNNQLKTLTS